MPTLDEQQDTRGMKFTKRATLYWPSKYEWCSHGRKLTLCADSFANKVKLPAGTTVIYAVFSKTHPNEEYFTITDPNSSAWWRQGHSKVREFQGTLCWQVERYLGKKYKAGYRFVHFEYES